MSLINRLPLGLQSLLGSKSLGDNPSELLQEVRPTVQLNEFWSVENIRAQSTTDAGPVTTGSAESLLIPSGEIWSPIFSAIRWNGAAAGRRMSLEYRVQTKTESGQQRAAVAWADFDNDTGQAWDFTLPYKWPRGVWLPAGTLIDAVVLNFVGAASGTLTHSMHWYRLRV